jgi:hypothetical protein
MQPTDALFARYVAAVEKRGTALDLTSEEYELLHVVAHRGERAASKLLKSYLHLPKPVSGMRVLLGKMLPAGKDV